VNTRRKAGGWYVSEEELRPLLNRATGDSYTHAAILVCASAAICSTAAVTSGA
jgi:hypothetical protein